MKVFAVASFVALLVSCSSTPDARATASAAPTASTTQSITASPVRSPSPSARVALSGALTSATVAPDQEYFFADGAVLYAVASPGTPPPYASRIQRLERSTSSWTDVFSDDAMFFVEGTSAGRAVMIEYREPPQGGGASDSRVLAVDLRSGAKTAIDAFALSAATYHGGGGGPVRPVARVVIGGGTVAWTRLNELAAGEIEGELRVSKIGSPSYTAVARSRQWVEPLRVDDSSVVYLITGTKFDEVHARDLRTGEDRRLVEFAKPDPAMGRSGVALSGTLIGWLETANPVGAARLVTVDMVSGAQASHDLGADYCVGLSGNELGFAWDCPSKAIASSLTYYDPGSAREVLIVDSAERPNTLQLVPGGFMWFDLPAGVRRVNLLTVAR